MKKLRYFVHYEGYVVDGLKPMTGSCTLTVDAHPFHINAIRVWETQIKQDNPMLETVMIDNYIFMGEVEIGTIEA